jgi:hypothetical protein
MLNGSGNSAKRSNDNQEIVIVEIIANARRSFLSSATFIFIDNTSEGISFILFSANTASFSNVIVRKTRGFIQIIVVFIIITRGFIQIIVVFIIITRGFIQIIIVFIIITRVFIQIIVVFIIITRGFIQILSTFIALLLVSITLRNNIIRKIYNSRVIICRYI